MMLRRILFFLIAASMAWGTASLPGAPARAQAQAELSALQVSLWPEYDRPSMLVIYRITLAPETTLPVNLAFRIPPGSEVLVTAVGASPNSVDEVKNTEQLVGTWKEVSFTATFPVIQFEYYDNGLQIEGQSRHYEYRWPGDYAVRGMTIEVQQPLNATEMRISPDLGSGNPDKNGVFYYTSQVGSLAAGQELEITLDYKKATGTLTIEELPVESSQPITASTPGRIQLGSALPWVLGFVGVLLIFGGGWWYWQSSRKGDRPEQRRRGRQARGERQAASEKRDEAGVYCHNCGKRAGDGDRFCRSCGTKLRTE